MRAGELRHRVTISNPTETADSFGQAIESYTTTGTRWAKVNEQQSGEMQINEGTVNKQQIMITLREGVTKIVSTRSRVLYDSLLFNVVSIADPDGEGKFVVVTAERIL